MRTFVWSFVAWHILHAAATCDACDDWKLERFNAYPQTTDPCYIDDPDGFLRTEEDVRYALDVCREAAQYFKTQRVRGCEHAHVLSFKVNVVIRAGAQTEREGQDLQSFADALYQQWNLARSSCEDAVLVLVSVMQHSVAVAVNPQLRDLYPLHRLTEKKNVFERHLEMAEIKEAVFKVLASLTDDAIVHNQYRYFLLILAALMILFVFVYPSDKGPHLVRYWNARTIHQEHVNTFVDGRSDLTARRPNEPFYPQETCNLCMNHFKNVSTRIPNSKAFVCSQNIFGSQVLGVTLKCGHRFCANCLKRWLPMNKICPYCRREVSEISSPIPTTAPSTQNRRPVRRIQPWEVQIPPPSLISWGSAHTQPSRSTPFFERDRLEDYYRYMNRNNPIDANNDLYRGLRADQLEFLPEDDPYAFDRESVGSQESVGVVRAVPRRRRPNRRGRRSS